MQKSELVKSGFFYQLRQYGISRIIMSYDFGISFMVFVILFQSYLFKSTAFNMLGAESTANIIAITSTIFSIIIAAIAIILSFSGTEFVRFIRKSQSFNNILFSFWYCCSTYLLIIILAFLKFIINFHPPLIISSFYSALVISGFLYALLQTFYVVASIMKFAHFMDYHDRITNAK